MKSRPSFLTLCASVAALSGFFAAAPQASAQTTVTTDPVGFTTLTAVGQQTVGAYAGNSYISLDLTRPADYAGLIPASGVSTSGSGTTILTFAAGTLTGLTLSGSGNSHYIEITNGSGAGAMSTIISSDNDHTITLADDLHAVIDNAGGTTTFKTRPHWTLSTAFGANNSAGFQGGTLPGNSDTVNIWDQVNQKFNTYYYNTTHSQWQQGGVAANDVIIPPDHGILIQRKQTNSVSFVVQGNVKLGYTGVYVSGSNNYACQPYPLSTLTLATSGLWTGNSSTGLLGGTLPGNADTVNIWDPVNQKFNTYYYNTTHSQWQQGGTAAGSTQLLDGAAILIVRKNGTPFTWYMPQPSMGL